MSEELEDKVRIYKELAKQEADINEKRKKIGAEISQMFSKDTKTLYVAEYKVQRTIRLLIKTSLAEARAIGATRQEEIVDKKEIKRLLELGYIIPNVERYETIMISNVKQPSPTT